MSERQGIEIDYCPQCRGVWLDRGELDKIIERSASEARPASPDNTRPPVYPQNPVSHGSHPSHHDKEHYKKKKRGGFLDDLFDFD
jgi:Zn-finger nucleic acid-binding protein